MLKLSDGQSEISFMDLPQNYLAQVEMESNDQHTDMIIDRKEAKKIIEWLRNKFNII